MKISITHSLNRHVYKSNFELFYMGIALLFPRKQVISDRTKSAESIDTFTFTIAHQDDNASF
jgi:hypothetical protein